MSVRAAFSTDVLRWLESGLERNFHVGDPTWPEHRGRWGVWDAEMQLVATCESQAMAEIVAEALNGYAEAIEMRQIAEAAEMDGDDSCGLGDRRE